MKSWKHPVISFQYLLCGISRSKNHLLEESKIVYLKVPAMFTWDFRRNCCVFKHQILNTSTTKKKSFENSFVYQGRLFADFKSNDEFDVQVTRGLTYNVKLRSYLQNSLSVQIFRYMLCSCVSVWTTEHTTNLQTEFLHEILCCHK